MQQTLKTEQRLLTNGTLRTFDTTIAAIAADQFQIELMQSDGTMINAGNYVIRKVGSIWRITFDQAISARQTLIIRRRTPTQRHTQFDYQTILDITLLDQELTRIFHIFEEIKEENQRSSIANQ